MSKALKLETIEAYLTSPRRRALAFPREIEKQFELDSNERRCQRLGVGILISGVLYNGFLIGDWLLVPDVLRMATWLHLAVVTPWMLATAWVIHKRPRPFLRECLAASIPLLIILQIDAGFALTGSDGAAHYQYVVIPTLLYTNVSLHRLTFPFARAVSAAILLCHAALVVSASYLPSPVALMVIVQIVICAYITLIANYTMERDLRRAYLYALRDRLRHAEADAAARHDTLTGIANRHHLDEELRKLWGAPKANEIEVPVSIVMMDVDHFKHLNDRYGHGAGDHCLKRIALILKEELQGVEGHAVRYGGEEFLLLLPGIQFIDAARVAERIRRTIETAAIPNEGCGTHDIVTASLGVAACGTSELAASELIAAADSALYAAKRMGRNQVWPSIGSREDQITSASPVGRLLA